jgi:GT2 family glycosyltransferase
METRDASHEHESQEIQEFRQMCRVLIITVDHQSAELTARMTDNLMRIKGNTELSLIIVRNGSSSGVAGSIHLPRESFDNVWTYESAVNRGYFGGVRQGLEWFQETQGDLPPWIIVCNNDIQIEQADFFERLSQLDPNGIGVIAPKIISCLTRLNQNPFMVRRPSRRRIGELRFWLKSYYLAFVHEKMSEWKKTGVSLKHRFLPGTPDGAGPQLTAIYAPHGSFLIFSKQFFTRGGFLDDGFFLYHEEIAVAETCRQVGLPIVYYPELCVHHEEHASTGRRFTRSIYERQRQSFQHLMSKYLADLI